MEYVYKRLDDDEVASVGRLLGLIHGVPPDAAALTKKYRTGAFGAENIGFLAYPREKLLASTGPAMPAAYYGVFPLAIQYDGREVLAAQSGDTVTHPDHRGKGLFIELARQTYALAQVSGIDFVFGFPNKNSFPGFKRKLAWEFPFDMLRLVRYVPTLPVGLLRKRYGAQPQGFSSYARSVVTKVFDVVTPTGNPWELTQNERCGVVRDHRFWSYKLSSGLFVRVGDVGVALKYDGDLNIGEITGEPSKTEMRQIMRRLDLLAALIGVNRIKSFFSPNSHLHKLLGPFGRCSSSLPYGYVNFGSDCDPSQIEYSYVDYDTF